MMFDVLIIGYGIAGNLHKNVYLNENHYIKKISLYDPYINIEKRNEINYVDRLDFVNSYKNETIFDICTNSDRHVEWIEFALDQGFKYLIVEKPLATSFADLLKIENRFKIETSLCSVNYNYLCSPVLVFIEKFIDSHKLKIQKVSTNFSKNRIRDSKTKRGADKFGDLLHNFLIEMPHQLSIALKLLGQIGQIDTCTARDMVDENQVFTNHGEGFIRVIHENGIVSQHFSNLMHTQTIRELIIEFEDGHILTGYFGVSPEILGKVVLRKNEEIIFANNILDKSIDSFLSKALLFFDNKMENPCNTKFAIDINKVILESVNRTNHKNNNLA